MSDLRKVDKDAKAARLSVRVTGELLAQIEKRAQHEGYKVGQMVRILLRGRLMELQKTVGNNDDVSDIGLRVRQFPNYGYRSIVAEMKLERDHLGRAIGAVGGVSNHGKSGNRKLSAAARASIAKAQRERLWKLKAAKKRFHLAPLD